MNKVLHAAAELQSVCESRGWRFCFIGGLAVMRWGEPRETVVADLTLWTGFGDEERFIQVLLQHFQGRIADAQDFALKQRVVLLRSVEGVGLDVSLAAFPYEELVVRRSSEFAFSPSVLLRTCSAEDLVVLKAFAGRGHDWVDVERLIMRQSGQLDWDYIHEQLSALAEIKGEPEILEQLKHRRSKYEQ